MKKAVATLLAACLLFFWGVQDYSLVVSGAVSDAAYAAAPKASARRVEAKKERETPREKERKVVRSKRWDISRRPWTKNNLPRREKISLRPKDTETLNRATGSLKSSLIRDLKFASSGQENRRLRKQGYNDPIKSRTSTYTRTTKRPEQYVRVYKEGKTEATGKWLLKARDIRGLTPQEIRNKYALPYVPTHYVNLTVPPNTKITTSVVNRQNAKYTSGKVLLGNGVQYELRPKFKEKIDLKPSISKRINGRIPMNMK